MQLKNFILALFAIILSLISYVAWCDLGQIKNSNNALIDTTVEVKSKEPVSYTPEKVVSKHSFYELDQKIFVTDQERKNLFEALGIEYVNELVFDFTPLLYVDAHLTDRYINDYSRCDKLTERYQDDIEKSTLVPMSIRWLGDTIGYGIFAEADISQDSFIGVYGGSVQDRSLVLNKDYAWAYPVTTPDGGAISVDGSCKGNELRFINDGIAPNCVVQYIIGKDDRWHVCYIASADIKKGEQFLISYGPAYWKTRSYAYQELSPE